jgi:hypothetical protein
MPLSAAGERRAPTDEKVSFHAYSRTDSVKSPRFICRIFFFLILFNPLLPVLSAFLLRNYLVDIPEIVLRAFFALLRISNIAHPLKIS